MLEGQSLRRAEREDICVQIRCFAISELRVQGSGFRVQDSGFRLQSSGFKVQGLGFEGLGFWTHKQDGEALSV